MLHLPYPVVNVLTKIDNLQAVGGADLPFRLDFYTEVQDLQQLLPALNAEQNAAAVSGGEKWEKLNEALISLVEDFGLIGFETLAVEDRQSMASLLRAIDRASGYVFAGAHATDESGRTLEDEASVWAQAMSDQWAGKMDVRDVEERWIDRKEEFDALEQKAWEDEARMAGSLPQQSVASVARQNTQDHTADVMKDEEMEDDDGLLAAQKRWEEEKLQKGDDGGMRVLRK